MKIVYKIMTVCLIWTNIVGNEEKIDKNFHQITYVKYDNFILHFFETFVNWGKNWSKYKRIHQIFMKIYEKIGISTIFFQNQQNIANNSTFLRTSIKILNNLEQISMISTNFQPIFSEILNSQWI